MSEEMFDEGFKNITNIDISSVVTKLMQDKYKDKGPDFKCNRKTSQKKTKYIQIYKSILDSEFLLLNKSFRSPNGCEETWVWS